VLRHRYGGRDLLSLLLEPRIWAMIFLVEDDLGGLRPEDIPPGLQCLILKKCDNIVQPSPRESKPLTAIDYGTLFFATLFVVATSWVLWKTRRNWVAAVMIPLGLIVVMSIHRAHDLAYQYFE
jgi:hypothetical protein